MLAKLRTLLSPTPSQNTLPLSDQFPHPQINGKDASQCPFMKKQAQTQPNPSKCPVSNQQAPNASADSDSEDEKPKGGCPFMGTSNKKKNPDLVLNENGYDEPFVSKYKFYLSPSKIDFSSLKQGPKSVVRRQTFDKYPIYLQHTLFFNGEDYQKVRSLECCSRFMAYEQLRQKGNKLFNKGKFYQALEFYQRAMSLFRWLEHYEPLNESTISSEPSNNLEHSFEELSQSGRNVNIDLQQEKTKATEASAAFEQLKSKYKQFFITYTDDNTRLCDGEEMIESADIDMRKSLLIQVYLNMCAAYINTHHYSLAEKVCDDGLTLSENVSQLYFRKAQSISLRKDSSLQKLQMAFKYIKIALEKRATQKIFSDANRNVLKMLNLHNAAEAYQECLQNIEKRIKEVSAQEKVLYEKVYDRTKEIHQIEQRMISEGKVPRERNDEPVLYETTEMKILERMIAKYVKVIEFYTQAKNHQQVDLAKKEFQEVLKIKNEVNRLFAIELRETDGELGGLQTEKIKTRAAYVKTAFAENVYNAGKFNFTMLEWVIKQIVKEEAEEKKRKIQVSEEQQASVGESAGSKSEGKHDFTKLGYLLLLIPLLGILFNMFAL